MELRITVILPAYNAEQYLSEALDSIASQTRHPDSVIIVDDGSTDGTATIARDWISGCNLHAQLLLQKHKGAAAAQNHALHHTKSDLIAILDADDIWLPNCLEVLEHAFQTNPGLVCCFGDAEVFNANGLIARSFFREKSIQSLAHEKGHHGLRIINESVYNSLLSYSYHPPTCSTLLSRCAIETSGRFDESFEVGYDHDLFLRLSRLGRFGYYPFPLSKVRRHDENLTHDSNALHFHQNIVAILTKMIQNSKELDLSTSELHHTLEAGAKHAQILLYIASTRGLRSYLQTRQSLKGTDFVTPTLQPRHFLRALYYSTLLGTSKIGARA